MRIFAALFALIALDLSSLAIAQESELRMGSVSVSAATSLRIAPIEKSASLAQLSEGTRLKWVEGQTASGFIRVIGDLGPVGWVRQADIKVIAQPPANHMALSSAKKACKAMADCTPDGCAAPGTPRALFNETKRQSPENGPAIALSFPDCWALQATADQLVGEGNELDAGERARLQNLQVANGTVHEGSLVRIIGFIARGNDPHPNTGESVNCNRPEPENNDFHIPLAATAGTRDFKGIVVEMIPQDRPASWTINRLTQAKADKKKIMVEGNLFYDNDHVVNSDSQHPISGQPPRRSLWEVHRITRFWACKQSGGECNPKTLDQWTEVK